MNFKDFVNKPVVSFDFDGVLHKSIIPGTTHPESYWTWQEWEPYLEVHKILKQESLENRIIVVSRRSRPHQDAMWAFIKHYNLPVEKIYTTDDKSKKPFLVKLGVIRHYDDDYRLEEELEGTNIELIYVDPT